MGRKPAFAVAPAIPGSGSDGMDRMPAVEALPKDFILEIRLALSLSLHPQQRIHPEYY
jgi:hypothetical protein